LLPAPWRSDYRTQARLDDGSSRSAILALLLPPEVRQPATAVLAVALPALVFHQAKLEPIRRHLRLAERRGTPHRDPQAASR
jgi:hypothetical protein